MKQVATSTAWAYQPGIYQKKAVGRPLFAPRTPGESIISSDLQFLENLSSQEGYQLTPRASPQCCKD